ncbi:MAG TPA: DoxX family protein [Polyangiaceae bacterium]|nr:DoxX family protein [Polyangiaceae bacterium]
MNFFTRLLSPHRDAIYGVLRIVSGVLFTFHGVQKIFGVLTQHQPPVGSQIWVGGIIELVGGILIAIGLFTRCAAFVASGTMAVAYTQFHWKLQFGQSFFPAVNQGELALVYAFLFLYIAAAGGGRFSVDAARKRS